MTKKKDNPVRQRWTERELQLLRDLYPHQHTDLVAAAVGRCAHACYRKASSMGLRKTRECIARVARERTCTPDHGSLPHRFQPGHATWNKGRPGSTGLHPNTAANHYKPGALNGRAAQLELPVGALRISSEGVLERKIGTESGSPSRRWRGVHRLVWEAAHGPVPAGHVVAFKPGCKTVQLEEITLDRLELITRAENMRRNSYHHNLPPELARVVQLRGVLSRAINQRTKKEAA